MEREKQRMFQEHTLASLDPSVISSWYQYPCIIYFCLFWILKLQSVAVKTLRPLAQLFAETFQVSSAACHTSWLSIHSLAEFQTAASFISWQTCDCLEHTDHTDGQRKNRLCCMSFEVSADILILFFPHESVFLNPFHQLWIQAAVFHVEEPPFIRHWETVRLSTKEWVIQLCYEGMRSASVMTHLTIFHHFLVCISDWNLHDLSCLCQTPLIKPIRKGLFVWLEASEAKISSLTPKMCLMMD